MVTLNCFD